MVGFGIGRFDVDCFLTLVALTMVASTLIALTLIALTLFALEGGHGVRTAVGSGGQKGRGGLRPGLAVRGARSARAADATDCRGLDEVRGVGHGCCLLLLLL